MSAFPARPASSAPGDESDLGAAGVHVAPAPLENVYVFGHHGFVQTVPKPPSTWTCRPAAVVLISADQHPMEVELKDGRVVAGRVIAVSSMIDRRLLHPGRPLLSFNVQPLHGGFPAFRALNPPGVVALCPEPFHPLADTLASAYAGSLGVDEMEQVFERVVALVGEQLPPIGMPDSRLAAVLAHLHEHPRAPATELGRAIGRSADWVSRTFSSDMGLSLRDYMSWLKQRDSFNILFSRRSITAVALDAGFVSASQLASAYQRWYGRTPSASRDPGKVRIFVSGLPERQAAKPAFSNGLGDAFPERPD